MNRRIGALHFVAAALAGHVAPDDVGRRDWGEIVALANRQLVSPALWAGLRAGGLADCLPPEAADYLCALHGLNVERNRRLIRQLLEVGGALQRHGIEVMPLKGIAHLAAGLFDDPGARILGDLDLLVPAERFDEAWAVLAARGYRAEAGERQAFAGHHHAAPLIRDGEEAPVELHRAVVDPRVALLLPTAAAWAESQPLEIEGVRMRMLTPTATVLQNILHSEIVDRNHATGVICLRALYDFVLLCVRHGGQIDWPRIRAGLQGQGQGRICEDYLHLARRLFGGAALPGSGWDLMARAHYRRCLLKVGFPLWCGHLPARFSAQRISRDYACGTSFLPLTLARLRHAIHLIRKHAGRSTL